MMYKYHAIKPIGRNQKHIPKGLSQRHNDRTQLTSLGAPEE